MTWLLLLLAYPAFYVAQCFYRMFREWRKARASGIAYFLAPIHPENILWMVFSPMFHKQMDRYLPKFLYSRICSSIYGWEVRYKNTLAEKYGGDFLIVNFYRSELSVSDPDIAHEILKRLKDFPNTTTGNFIMGKFGPNLVTAAGSDWARQRKFIAPNINEKISASVWNESLEQTEQMMDHIAANGGSSNDTGAGFKSIAINVLGAAGYGKPRPWDDDKAVETAPAGYHVTYMQAMRYLVENLVEMAFISPSILTLPIWPKSITDTGHAVNELKGLTQDLLEKERRQPSETVNIMKLLIENEGDVEKTGNRLYNSEVVGNLFVFSAAGFDTTANTMAYGLVLLAIHPQWQDWIIEELDEVVPKDPNAGLDYNECFPKLTHILAVMHETPRTFPPIVHLAKRTDDKPIPLTNSQGKEVIIPAHTTIYINSYAVANNPKVWDDPRSFMPTRWISYAETDDGKPSTKAFIKPAPKGSFLAWSTGPRACPGQKMSQVEFVSVFTQIFRRYRVEVVKKDGESDELARKRAEDCMNDSAPKLTVAMVRPKDLELRFVERSR